MNPMRSIVLVALLLGILAGASAAQEVGAPLAIVTEGALPRAILTASYEVTLAARGGVPPRTWEVIAGRLPEGLNLDPVTGAVSGTPTALGQFRFAVEVSDSDDPADTRTREFTLTVISALVVEWKAAPAVTPDGISGSVKLANQTANDVDLTLIVVAVNEVGKAFALGYQYFTFAGQSTIPEIPFGSSLPQGSYIVHADVIAEVPDKNAIYRARLQTAEPLTTH
jgi:Putative Ig domain